MCLDASLEIGEFSVWEQRSYDFLHDLRGLASQSDWTSRYPSAKFPTAVKGINEPRMVDVGSYGEGDTTPWTWRHHVRGLASISSALLKAAGDQSEFDIADFIVAGSLGKDTAVEHVTTDVDILVVFNAFDPSRYSKYLAFIEDALLRGSSAENLKLIRKRFPVRMTGKEKSIRDGPAEVGGDIIPRGEAEYLRVVWKGGEVAEILPGGMLTHAPKVTSDADREFWGTWCANFAYSPWSPCCTEFSVDFVGKQPAHVLIAIRALKEWRNALKIKMPHLTVSSFALELLAIATNRDHNWSTSRDVFVGVLEVLCRPDDRINIFWTVYYTREAIPKDILAQRPLVLDPAKHWNNAVQKSNLLAIRPLAKKALAALGYQSCSSEIVGGPELPIMLTCEKLPKSASAAASVSAASWVCAAAL